MRIGSGISAGIALGAALSLAVLLSTGSASAQARPQSASTAQRMEVRHPDAIWYASSPGYRGATTSLITPDGGRLQRQFPFLAGAAPHLTFGCTSREVRGSHWALTLTFRGAGNAIKTPGPEERAYVEGTDRLMHSPGKVILLGDYGKVLAAIDINPSAEGMRTSPVDSDAMFAFRNAKLIRIETPTMLLESGVKNLEKTIEAMSFVPCAAS